MRYWEWDFISNRIEWSEGLWKIFGYANPETRPSVLNYDFYLNHLPASEQMKVTERHQQARAAGDTEVTIITRQGELRQIIDSYRAFYNSNGTFEKMIGYVLDITVQRKARQQQEEFQTMQTEAERSFGYGSWVWDIETNTVTWSSGMWLLLGFGIQHYTGLPREPDFYHQFVHPEDITHLRASTPTMMETGNYPVTIHRIVARDGIIKTIEAKGKFFEISGQSKVIGSVVDITERQRDLERLIQYEQLLSEAEKIFSYGSWIWEIDKDEIYWSEGFMNLLGYTPETFGNNPQNTDFYFSHLHPEDVGETKAHIRLFIESDAIDYEGPYNRIITRQGEIRIIKSRGKVERTAGVPKRFIGSTIDFTSIKKAEAELESKVQELARSNAELEQFAYVASHDLQEPLRKVQAFSGLLVKEYEPLLQGNGQLYIQRIQNSIARMQNLINDLLAFSRIGRLGDPFAETSLTAVVQQVLSDQEETIRQKNATIDISPLPDLDAVPVEMHLLFSNLLSNALKFSQPDRVPHIQITSEPLPASEKSNYRVSELKSYFKITVQDNGIGFEPEYAQKIFIIFQRLHGKAEYPGTGIGLAICKRIMDNHHGAIFADSQPGQGSALLLPSSFPYSNKMQSGVFRH